MELHRQRIDSWSELVRREIDRAGLSDRSRPKGNCEARGVVALCSGAYLEELGQKADLDVAQVPSKNVCKSGLRNLGCG